MAVDLAKVATDQGLKYFLISFVDLFGVLRAKLRGIKRLPLTLLDALRIMEKSRILREGFGDEVVRSYLSLKMDEWLDYTGHLSQWEREHTLDC